jgi:cell division protein ZapA
MNATKLIRINILGRDYPLRVEEQDEAHILQLGRELDERMKLFRAHYPNEPEVTGAMMLAIQLADELSLLRRDVARKEEGMNGTLHDLLQYVEEFTEPAVLHPEPLP